MTAHFQLSDFLCRCCGQGREIVRPDLLKALEWVRDDYDHPMVVDCGYRCPKHNAEVNGALGSAHLVGAAADISDPNGDLKAWLTADMLEDYGLWAEDFRRTPTWVHLQIRPAKQRIFTP